MNEENISPQETINPAPKSHRLVWFVGVFVVVAIGAGVFFGVKKAHEYVSGKAIIGVTEKHAKAEGPSWESATSSSNQTESTSTNSQHENNTNSIYEILPTVLATSTSIDEVADWGSYISPEINGGDFLKYKLRYPPSWIVDDSVNEQGQQLVIENAIAMANPNLKYEGQAPPDPGEEKIVIQTRPAAGEGLDGVDLFNSFERYTETNYCPDGGGICVPEGVSKTTIGGLPAVRYQNSAYNETSYFLKRNNGDIFYLVIRGVPDQHTIDLITSNIKFLN